MESIPNSKGTGGAWAALGRAALSHSRAAGVTQTWAVWAWKPRFLDTAHLRPRPQLLSRCLVFF